MLLQLPWRNEPADQLTTIGRVFDGARGITLELRQVIQWIASNGRWVRREQRRDGVSIWRGINSGGVTVTKEAVRHAVVLELARLGVLALLAPNGGRLTPGGEPGHAQLLQVA